MNKIGYVTSSAPSQISIEIDGLSNFEKNKVSLQVGKLLKIADGNHNYAVASIRNISGQQQKDSEGAGTAWKFTLDATPIGALVIEGDSLVFKRGTQVLPVPTENAFTFELSDLELIFSASATFNFPIGTLSGNKQVPFFVDGDKFFGKHVGVVGSTGSGKSCTVATLLQTAVGLSKKKNLHVAEQKNSHILIFDIHSEYASAFSIGEDEKFNLNLLNVDTLKIPYWLMNAEELENLFIESGEQNSHNQISQFKRAVILNKIKYNNKIKKITYDTPVYFSIFEVFNFINNKNNLTVYVEDSKTYFACLKDKKIEYSENGLWEELDFEMATGNGQHSILKAKVSKEGGFTGEFDRFVSRLETRLQDKRLDFLLRAKKEDGTNFGTADFDAVLKQFLGYINKANITIVDLSGIPFEVLSITVSLIARLIFDFAFHYSKICHAKHTTNDIPFMIVCEEAHNYIPKDGGADYYAAKKSLERIAKEGRKYGLSLMVVSQRPSEVSDTIFSQCSNFVSLRLTNKADQNYIKALLPDGSSDALELLPILQQGEAFIVGDAVLMPSLVQLLPSEPEPKSASIKSYTEWNSNWKAASFDEIIKRWRNGSEATE
jgi:DNA helicase HerA-like ATPase